jgi:hypothetical protein
MADSQFDKDFGYLMPFLDKVAAAAGNLPDQAGRAELAALVADEKQRWTRIRQLLSGATSETAASATRQSPAAGTPVADRPITDTSARQLPSFTVGSLRSPKR